MSQVCGIVGFKLLRVGIEFEGIILIYRTTRETKVVEIAGTKRAS